MKRKKYEVVLDDKVVATKFAFNTAAESAVMGLVREIGRTERQTYTRREATIQRSETDYYDITGGTRVWVGDRTGRRLEFMIRQVV